MAKLSENNFIYKPLAIVQDKRLTPLEQDYLCLIAQLEKANGCTASNNYFARYFGVSRPRAVEVITGLRKKRFIKSSEKKQDGKTIERTIWIIDIDSKKTLLINSKEVLPSDSKETPAGLVRKTDFDSKESPHPTIESTTDKTNTNGFEVFWNKYPIKRNKGKAFESWEKIKPNADLQDKMQKAISVQIKSAQWQKENGRFIPYPATWLDKKRWEDEFKPTQPAKTKLCLVDKQPVAFEVRTGVYLCEDCRKAFEAAPTPKSFKGNPMPKNRLEKQQIEDLILKQKAAITREIKNNT